MKYRKITNSELSISIFTDGSMKIHADRSTHNLFLSKLSEIMNKKVNQLISDEIIPIEQTIHYKKLACLLANEIGKNL